MADFDLIHEPLMHRYLLVVDPWTTLGGTTQTSDPNLCLDTEPLFYRQPTTGDFSGSGTHIAGCSGFLVGTEPGLVVSAGHCIGPGSAPYPCLTRYVVFGFSDFGPFDPEDPIYIPEDQVVRCEEVIVDTYEGENTELSENALCNPDWALLRLVEPSLSVDTRLPLVIERRTETQEGDPVLVLGHPARIPLKAEITEAEPSLGVNAHALDGNSGSALVNLDTGKVFSNLACGGAAPPWVTVDGCAALCFECDGTFNYGTPTPTLAAHPSMPVLGLQVAAPGITPVDYYGPPTVASDFTDWQTSLSVAENSLPSSITEVAWAFQQEDKSVLAFEIIDGASSGTLVDGETIHLTIRPTDAIVGEPGLFEKVVPFFDYTYGTRTRVTHRAHVGVDGFQVFPSAALVGEGPGVPETMVANYTVTNRWIVDQQVTVSTTDDWILLNGQHGPSHPVTLDLFPDGTGFPGFFSVSFDGGTMEPDVHLGSLLVTSNDSGIPAYEESRDIRLDYCREITELADSFPLDVPPEDFREVSLTVTEVGTIKDVDIAVHFASTTPPGFKTPRHEIAIFAPDGASVVLKDSDGLVPTVYDDETAPPFEPLSNLDGRDSSGLLPWRLRFSNLETEVSLVGSVERFEVRLHRNEPQSCDF